MTDAPWLLELAREGQRTGVAKDVVIGTELETGRPVTLADLDLRSIVTFRVVDRPGDTNGSK